MKIKPQKHYRKPDYPTIRAAGSAQALLARIPNRWRKSIVFSTAVGIGFIVKALLTGSDTPVTQPPTPSSQNPDQSDRGTAAQKATSQIRKAGTLVAPILAEALAHDGRGAFGCVAVNPPCFLSEAEALDLIVKEFKTTGLNLKISIAMEGLKVPDPKTSIRTASRSEPKLKTGEHIFDLADIENSVYIEYLSQWDYRQWMGRSLTTVDSFDFPNAVSKVSNALEKRRSEKREVFGIFFDPLARANLPRPDTRGLNINQKRMVLEEYDRASKEEREHLKDKAKEKLQRQVQHFVTCLREEGVIDKMPIESTQVNSTEKARLHASDASPDPAM
jgi:hypothetical protein